ncbi:hypothetical protein QQ045_007387 [Rhodiola kirilowii]
MKALGFNAKWCDLIYRLISNYWYSVLWDGFSFGHFKSNQGVRQGDPISRSLFVVSMEMFSRLLLGKIGDGSILSYFVKPRTLPISHLLYADDMLLFTNGREDSVEALMAVINSFGAWSGQRVNAAKSSMFIDNMWTIQVSRIFFSLQVLVKEHSLLHTSEHRFFLVG